MSDIWAGPLLVAGTITGVRHFGVTGDGWLYGPSTVWPFKPGENVAVHRGPDALPVVWGGGALTIDRLDRRVRNTLYGGYVSWDDKHRIAGERCKCGFYAYYSYDYATYARDDRACAVIEGYGRVTVGNRGFRCEKARVVAITTPHSRYRKVLERRYEVPVYLSHTKMLRHHPLSGPPEPEPEPEIPDPLAVAIFAPIPVQAHVNLVTPDSPRKVLPPPPPDTPPKRWTWWRRR